ncbi:MAG TPA: helix-turn-helix domain-containing protein, partial [Thermopolyspora sp.]
MPEPKGPLQTLDRGLSMLDLVSQAPGGITMSELAEHIGVHRTVCYRLVGTLAAHRLVVRGSDGRI